VTCSVAGCAGLIRSKFSPYCEMHYYRIRRNGTPERIRVIKYADSVNCIQCGADMVDPFRHAFCSERCAFRFERGRTEQAAQCVICGGDPGIPDVLADGKIHSSWELWANGFLKTKDVDAPLNGAVSRTLRGKVELFAAAGMRLADGSAVVG
jgi:hypothetical protein